MRDLLQPPRGTLRGLHLPGRADAEAKLVRCIARRAFDVVVDLRPDSPTYGRWFAAELSPDDGRMLYMPEGFAHGFQTLEPTTRAALPDRRRITSAEPAARRALERSDACHRLALAEPAVISARDRAFHCWAAPIAKSA